MAKITLKLNKRDLQEILKKGQALEKELTSKEGAVYSFMLVISNGYKEAVLSGIGKTTEGTMSLKDFLGSVQTVKWRKNARKTLRRKMEEGWALTIWKASGETERAVKVYENVNGKQLNVFSGIDGGKDRAAYEKAIRVEFATEIGAKSIPGDKAFDSRALFTLLNAVFQANSKVIMQGIIKGIRESIVKVGWGRS